MGISVVIIAMLNTGRVCTCVVDSYSMLAFQDFTNFGVVILCRHVYVDVYWVDMLMQSGTMQVTARIVLSTEGTG